MVTATFKYRHRVSYSECTAGNHIYYSRYLDILELARGEFFRHLGTPMLQWQEQEIIFPVIECHLRYHAPARYDDLLTVELWLGELRPVCMKFNAVIHNAAGVKIITAETIHACTGTNEKPRRIPDELAGLLEPYVHSEKTKT
ncbi:MAG TPA: thioesterase family protein [Verrucomicrobiae bacterium]|jgi:acyl-CoA thioester hydrolase|nr:thioesterase family protein [Verrucomicrobiae bacterium]